MKAKILLADNSYFNIDGKHFHTKICIEKMKLTIKDVCKEKNVNDIWKVTCQLWSTPTAFLFKFGNLKERNQITRKTIVYHSNTQNIIQISRSPLLLIHAKLNNKWKYIEQSYCREWEIEIWLKFKNTPPYSCRNYYGETLPGVALCIFPSCIPFRLAWGPLK